jgi:FHS family L-fucose permease-like MFS transporter
VFLASLFVLASGITLLQVAVNPYVTLLGSPEGAAFRLNLVQAFNSLGTTLAPLAGSMLILENADKIRAIQVPYLILTLSLVTVAWVFSRIALPSMSEYSNQEIPEDEGSFTDSLRRYGQTLQDHPRLVLGMLAIFFYVGAEVSIGSFLVSWLGDTSVAGMSPEQAGRYVAFYWGGAMVGRFIGSVLTSRIQPEQVLAGSVILCLILILAGVTSASPTVATWALILIGLFNSIQFPTIFSLSVSGLGKATPYASGLLCTCIVGGALIPLLQGVLADQISLRWSYAVPFLSYLYILLTSRKLSSAGGRP